MFRSEAKEANAVAMKKKKEREEEEQRRKDAIRAKQEREAVFSKNDEPPVITEITDEEAEKLQKEIDKKDKGYVAFFSDQ